MSYKQRYEMAEAYKHCVIWSNASVTIQRAWRCFVEPPLVKVSKVTATYCDYVITCRIKGDLTTAHKWYVKKDTLHVQWKEGDKYVVYETPFLSEFTDNRSAYRIDVKVEEMTVEEADAECNEP